MPCTDCKFFVDAQEQCARFPAWRPVHKQHWCGEHKPKAKPSQPDMFKPDKKGSRLTADWVLDEEIGKWAVGQGLDVAEVLAEEQKFRDYWISVPGKQGVKLDWNATWRNWIRRAVSDKQNKKAR